MARKPRSLSIFSPVDKIEDLRIYEFPAAGVITNVTRMVTAGDVTVFQDDKGILYTNRPKGGFYYASGSLSFTVPLLKALVKLGVLSPEHVQEHIDRCTKLYEERQKARDARELGALAAKYDIRIPGTEWAKVLPSWRDYIEQE